MGRFGWGGGWYVEQTQREPGDTDCQVFPFDDVAARVTHRKDKSVDELFMKCI